MPITLISNSFSTTSLTITTSPSSLDTTQSNSLLLCTKDLLLILSEKKTLFQKSSLYLALSLTLVEFVLETTALVLIVLTLLWELRLMMLVVFAVETTLLVGIVTTFLMDVLDWMLVAFVVETTALARIALESSMDQTDVMLVAFVLETTLPAKIVKEFQMDTRFTTTVVSVVETLLTVVVLLTPSSSSKLMTLTSPYKKDKLTLDATNISSFLPTRKELLWDSTTFVTDSTNLLSPPTLTLSRLPWDCTFVVSLETKDGNLTTTLLYTTCTTTSMKTRLPGNAEIKMILDGKIYLRL